MRPTLLRGAEMDSKVAATCIQYFLSELRRRLEEAATIAKAADACSGAGNRPRRWRSRWMLNS